MTKDSCGDFNCYIESFLSGVILIPVIIFLLIVFRPIFVLWLEERVEIRKAKRKEKK